MTCYGKRTGKSRPVPKGITMTDQRKAIRLTDAPRNADPAAAAWERLLQAGNNDAVYDRAREDIEMLPATTLRGVQAKLAILQADLGYHFQGDQLTREDEITVLGRLGGIEEALARFTGYRVPANWKD